MKNNDILGNSMTDLCFLLVDEVGTYLDDYYMELNAVDTDTTKNICEAFSNFDIYHNFFNSDHLRDALRYLLSMVSSSAVGQHLEDTKVLLQKVCTFNILVRVYIDNYREE